MKCRQILIEDLCAECNLESETTGHVFWSCPRAQKIWTCSGMFQIGFNGLFHTFMDLLWKLMMVDDWNQDNIALMVTVAWSIWCTRNEVQNGGKKKSELELVHGARVLL